MSPNKPKEIFMSTQNNVEEIALDVLGCKFCDGIEYLIADTGKIHCASCIKPIDNVIWVVTQ